MSGIGTSGSLIPLTGNVTIPAGTEQGDLVGYRNFGTTTRTVNGETVPPGEYAIFTWNGTMWIRIDAPAGPPDTEPPTAPTNLQATPGANTVTLTWSPATDNVGVGGYEARVQQSGMSTWTAWAPLASGGGLSGLTPSTGYTAQVRALDYAANTGPAATVTFTTTALPLIGDITDTFTGTSGDPIIGRTTTTGGAVWEEDTDGLLAGSGTTLIVRNNRLSTSQSNARARLPVTPGPIEVSADYDSNAIMRLGIGGAVGSVVYAQMAATKITKRGVGGDVEFVGAPTRGRVTLRWDGTDVTISINGEPVLGPMPVALTSTGYVAVSIGNAPRVDMPTEQSFDDLAVTYL